MPNPDAERELAEAMVANILECLAASAYIAWVNTISGYHVPAAKFYCERMHDPQPGDLVLEVTNWKARPLDRIGRLISVGMENPPPEVVDPQTYDESEWERPYPPYQEKIWRIRTLDGREYRWWNADFIVIPEDPFRHQGSGDELASRQREKEGRDG